MGHIVGAPEILIPRQTIAWRSLMQRRRECSKFPLTWNGLLREQSDHLHKAVRRSNWRDGTHRPIVRSDYLSRSCDLPANDAEVDRFPTQHPTLAVKNVGAEDHHTIYRNLVCSTPRECDETAYIIGKGEP